METKASGCPEQASGNTQPPDINATTSVEYRGIGRIRSVDTEAEAGHLLKTYLLVAYENGTEKYWTFEYAIEHSAEISNIGQFISDFESGWYRLGAEETALLRKIAGTSAI